ncbi:glycoside hydrolase family 17 protein [Phanerochaete carnosa HHB-10118-sp]|uniref:glucan endo-1,3-beta-D-glucosidase n=1 Tax=Phanerochaete carnosa (strain HHB-10118-sp) TaxID=650164 RepID=K5WGQ9_PHACS|nr:glycoside hydrolase family 17 protein [Phanerochaete carnosa HHB-10118-sp]EKM58510.1 glycoside hydrolase family 17 protein [Phanerochaete carnosa HHB-10118-sp]
MSGIAMRQYRDIPAVTGSTPDLQNYYDSDVPPPHRLSGIDDPYASTTHLPPTPDSRGNYLPTSSSTANLNMADTRGFSNMDNGAGYAGGNGQWLEKQQTGKSKSKWILIASLVGLAGLVVAGIVIGVVVSRNHKSSSSSSSSLSTGTSTNSSGTPAGPTGVVNQTDPNDPSTFVKDPNLKQSFYGIAYTPANSQLPNCGNSLSEVIEDIQLLSQLTSRIRLYGADCNQSALVLEAIKQTKVNMTVWLANYNVPTDGGTAYERQRGEIQAALQTYGTDHVGGVTVGNEFILDFLSANGGGDSPNGAVGNAGAQLLIPNITDTRNMLASMNINLPVGTADAGSYFNNEVLEAVDYGMSNVHPWFANVSIDQAAGWTWDFFQTENVEVAQSLTNKPNMYIAETGWPTNSTDAGNESNGPSNASVANLQYFLDTFVCASNTNGTEYFFFEYFDEVWKLIEFGGVEGYWGLFYANKTLKPVTIPDCTT